MKWKTFVARQNAKTYVMPAGWDSRESVAEQLGCSPDRVDDHLRPSLKSGEVEKGQFKVWSSTLERNQLVIGYRFRAVPAEKPKTASR